MTVVDFLWVFACGGYFGWTCRQIGVNRERRALIQSYRQGRKPLDD